MTNRRKNVKPLELCDANSDETLAAERVVCQDLCHELNLLKPSQESERMAVFRRLFGKTAEHFTIVSPFICDYGYNVEIGEHTFINMNCVILDEAKVVFGNHVFVAPSCGFYTASHPLDVARRNQGMVYAAPITVGDNVWIGGHVCVLPGVTIGEGSVIGAGSVVTEDVPPYSLAYGNPCRVVRKITEEDRKC